MPSYPKKGDPEKYHARKLTLPIKRVAFVLYRYPLGVSSMIINSIRLFARKGYLVDVYVNKEHYNQSPITFTESGISVIIYDDRSFRFFFKCYRFLSKRVGDYFLCIAKRLSLKACLLLFFPGIYRFMKWLNGQMARRTYSYVFPVECMSLICLSFIVNKRKIIYFNLELLDWEKGDLLYGNNKLVLKYLEYSMIKALSRIVTPSPRRSSIFSQINYVEQDNIFSLPIVPLGDSVIRKSRFFREMFKVPEKHRIVLYCGQFVPYFQCIEIIQTVLDWPNDTVLIMHTWNRTALRTQYYKEMKKAASGLPVYFSTHYIPYDDLADAMSSADMGLAFYEAVDRNYTEILFSSNKIGEYLKAGLGIICSDFPSVKQFVEAHDIGMAVPVHELPRAIRGISERIDSVRDNVLQCYNNELRFENYFNRFYDRL
jgi:glycosyltransferase involved in cell wall biosynthesis